MIKGRGNSMDALINLLMGDSLGLDGFVIARFFVVFLIFEFFGLCTNWSQSMSRG